MKYLVLFDCLLLCIVPTFVLKSQLYLLMTLSIHLVSCILIVDKSLKQSITIRLISDNIVLLLIVLFTQSDKAAYSFLFVVTMASITNLCVLQHKFINYFLTVSVVVLNVIHFQYFILGCSIGVLFSFYMIQTVIALPAAQAAKSKAIVSECITPLIELLKINMKEVFKSVELIEAYKDTLFISEFLIINKVLVTFLLEKGVSSFIILGDNLVITMKNRVSSGELYLLNYFGHEFTIEEEKIILLKGNKL